MEDSNDERGVVCTIELSSTCTFFLLEINLSSFNMHEDVGLL